MNPITPAELTVQKSVKSIETRGESAVKCGGDDAERKEADTGALSTESVWQAPRWQTPLWGGRERQI